MLEFLNTAQRRRYVDGNLCSALPVIDFNFGIVEESVIIIRLPS
jgi:hypothetical protein